MRATYVVNNQFPGDGVGHAIVELARLLVAEGADLRVLYEKAADPPGDLADRFVQVGYRELRDRRGSSPGVRAAVAHWLASDVVFFDYSIHYPLVEAIALPHPGARVFVYHGVTPPRLWPPGPGRDELRRGVEQLRLARHADYAVAASEFTADELTAAGVCRDRVAVLPYVIHADRFGLQPKDDTLQRLWGLHGHFVLLYTGRMAPNKRIATLVEGMAAARRAGLPVKLLLVGDNQSPAYQPEVRAAREAAWRQGVGEHVVFTGPVTDALLARCYNLADVYVSASVHEGFGIPPVEAMACAKPVVAARAASVPSVVGPAGLYFEPDDAEAMGRAVVELLGSAAPAPAPERPPRLCFVVPRYGPGFAGGAETLCRRWAETCHAAGWPVRVVTTTTACMVDWRDYFPAGDGVLNGVPLTRFPVQRGTWREHFELHHCVNHDPGGLSAADERRWVETGIGRPPLFSWLADHRGDFDYFVFLPFLFNTTLLGVEAVGDKAVVIPCLHDEGPAYTRVVCAALERARAVFFNAPAERDFALRTLRLANPNCFTLGMGMDLDRRGDAGRFRARFGLPGEFFLYCGRIEDGKNVPLLVEYFGRYKADRPGPLKLVLVGNGAAPAHPDVIPLGFLSEQDKLDGMAAAVALINPSVNESFSIVVMESWVQGRPVLVHGGCAVTSGHVRRCRGGLCFEDEVQFNAAIDTLRAFPEAAARHGAQGRRYVEDHYAWPRLLARFRQRLDLLRTSSRYEELALRAVARARDFDGRAYAGRWRAFLRRLAARAAHAA